MGTSSEQKIAFGPVPSRRLGRSLGINNIPSKTCSYCCVYCQLGRTIRMQVHREAFYEPDEVFSTVKKKMSQAQAADEAIDYLSFVPDGEPTLDLNLGREIDLLRSLHIPIAVITNASLIWREDVQADLLRADWVSLKVDAVDEGVWRRIDRPHGQLQLSPILEGALAFADAFEGELATETMLVEGLNDDGALIEEIGDLLARLQPAVAYLAVPTRPPAEAWVRSPREDVVTRAYQLIGQKVDHVEYLIGYEGNAFAFTGNVAEDLLSITAVHPMRREAVDNFLARAEADWSVVQRLVLQDQLVETDYDGRKFYTRKLHGRTR